MRWRFSVLVYPFHYRHCFARHFDITARYPFLLLLIVNLAARFLFLRLLQPLYNTTGSFAHWANHRKKSAFYYDIPLLLHLFFVFFSLLSFQPGIVIYCFGFLFCKVFRLCLVLGYHVLSSRLDHLDLGDFFFRQSLSRDWCLTVKTRIPAIPLYCYVTNFIYSPH